MPDLLRMSVSQKVEFGCYEMFLSWNRADNLISEAIYYKIEFNVFLPFSCGNLDYISVLPEQDHFKYRYFPRCIIPIFFCTLYHYCASQHTRMNIIYVSLNVRCYTENLYKKSCKRKQTLRRTLQLSMFLWFPFWLYLPDVKHDYHVLDNSDIALPKSCLQHIGIRM